MATIVALLGLVGVLTAACSGGSSADQSDRSPVDESTRQLTDDQAIEIVKEYLATASYDVNTPCAPEFADPSYKWNVVFEGGDKYVVFVIADHPIFGHKQHSWTVLANSNLVTSEGLYGC